MPTLSVGRQNGRLTREGRGGGQGNRRHRRPITSDSPTRYRRGGVREAPHGTTPGDAPPPGRDRRSSPSFEPDTSHRGHHRTAISTCDALDVPRPTWRPSPRGAPRPQPNSSTCHPGSAATRPKRRIRWRKEPLDSGRRRARPRTMFETHHRCQIESPAHCGRRLLTCSAGTDMGRQLTEAAGSLERAVGRDRRPPRAAARPAELCWPSPCSTSAASYPAAYPPTKPRRPTLSTLSPEPGPQHACMLGPLLRGEGIDEPGLQRALDLGGPRDTDTHPPRPASQRDAPGLDWSHLDAAASKRWLSFDGGCLERGEETDLPLCLDQTCIATKSGGADFAQRNLHRRGRHGARSAAGR